MLACSSCGRESPLAEAFYYCCFLGNERRLLCPLCAEKDNRRGCFGPCLLSLVLGGIGGILVSTHHYAQSGRVLFTLSLFCPFVVLSLFLHEAGHALLSRLIGMRVLRMVFGTGPRIFQIMMGATRLDIRAVPNSGYVVSIVGKNARLRFRLKVLTVIRQYLQDHPGELWPGFEHVVALVQTGSLEDARQLCVSMLSDGSGWQQGQLAIVASMLARCDMGLRRPELQEEAVRASAEAYVMWPWQPVICATRGSVLVRSGDAQNGLALLKQALCSDISPKEKEFVTGFIVEAEQSAIEGAGR